jgi:exopolysaccharide production protein ExoQ
VLWSSQRASTLSAAASLAMSTIFAIYLAGRYSSRELTALLGRVVVVLALASAVFAIGAPRYGIDHFAHNGAWQGVFVQKNALGLVMCMGVGLLLGLEAEGFAERAWKFCGLLLCLADLGLSRSREAWIAAALMLLFHAAFKLYERFAQNSRAVLLLMASLAALIAAGTVAALWLDILKLLGRDATMTGRTILWPAVLEQCKQHPFLGYGMSAFWGTGAATPIYAQTGWIPTSAHNGFLECLLDLGAIGLILLLIVCLLGVWYGFRIILRSRSFSSSKPWIYCLMGILLINEIADVTGITNSICWALVVTGACVLEQTARGEVPVHSRAMTGADPFHYAQYEAR